MTQHARIELSPRVGRKKEFPNRITLPLSDELLADIDSVLDDGEARLDMIRSAIEAEVKRRRRLEKRRADG